MLNTEIIAQKRDRNQIPETYKWNLSEIYSSNKEWDNAKDKFVKKLSEIEKFKGSLSKDTESLFACLNFVTNLNKEFTRLYCYASMNLDQDTREQSYLGMVQSISMIGNELAAKISFIEPEILNIPQEKLQAFINSKTLLTYKHYLSDLLRRKAHTKSEAEEKIIADAGLMADAPSNIHSIFANADFPYPEITLSDGNKVKLDASGFALHRTSKIREDRKKVFSAFMNKLGEFKRTYGTQLNAQIKKDIFYQKARTYSSCLHSALDANNIPTQVYYNLIENVNKNLDSFHRYLKLRKKILKLDTLHYYDLYAPLVDDVDLKYSIEESQENIVKALEPLGNEYTNVLQKAFKERWIDVYPNEGKRCGAYSNGSVYDVHPYILLNYNGKYDDMSTFAHELGHTMHSYLSNKNQPYQTADYPIFVAEVASTFNEALLIDYMLKNIKDDKTKLSLLGNYLEGIKGTIFRQTQFAEFELRIHELAEKGEPLTGESLSSLYFDIVKKYYGHNNNICIVDDEIMYEWMYIPHFYYNFYVYQYATAYTASAALSERTINGDKKSTQKYLQFLSSGGSDYPINLLKTAGVDMTSSEPFELTMQKMNKVMNEIENIL